MDWLMTNTAGPASSKPQATPLPQLREDLSILKGQPDALTGLPSWLIYDALRHRYIQIDHLTFEVVSLWQSNETVEQLAGAASAKLGENLDASEVTNLIGFLDSNLLLRDTARQNWRTMSATAGRGRGSISSKLLHNYLFFKIPLFAPQTFLQNTQHLVEPLYRPGLQAFIGLIGLIGLYLVAREWDAFIGEAARLASFNGAMSIAVTLFVVKAFHELGHAYTALRYRCKVPSMGLAFMMMAPLLYTDVTDAWRLTDRRQRLAIDMAGVVTEIGIACLATFLWVFLPDGQPRHLAFLIATTSWIMSLAVNLNPFMKFDGYYITADYLGVGNLQSRSFELGRWKLRELLFSLNRPSPERLPTRTQRLLFIYAYAVWIYRLVLFTGIALMVYHYFFKILGLLLFLVEIVYFIAIPVVDELKEWWTMRREISINRRWQRASLSVILALLVMFVPWKTQVHAPGLLSASNTAKVYPSRSGQVQSVAVQHGQTVKAGELLVAVVSPDLVQDQKLTRARLAATSTRLSRIGADGQDLANRTVLEEQRQSLDQRLAGLNQEISKLDVRAPIDGVIVELNTDVIVGRWLPIKEHVATIVAERAVIVAGFIEERDVWRIRAGADAKFIPDVPLAQPVPITLDEIAPTGTATIDIPELASPNGGPIETLPDSSQGQIANAAHYRLTLSATGDHQVPHMELRGTVYIDGASESLFARLYRSVVKVLVRESGV
jgi:putative peptide zinc metalloprotease protein